jgi:hypothetical protein
VDVCEAATTGVFEVTCAGACPQKRYRNRNILADWAYGNGFRFIGFSGLIVCDVEIGCLVFLRRFILNDNLVSSYR